MLSGSRVKLKIGDEEDVWRVIGLNEVFQATEENGYLNIRPWHASLGDDESAAARVVSG